MGTAVVWREKTHPTATARTNEEGGTGKRLSSPYHPRRVPDDWTGQRFHLGKNKGIFDAEFFAIYRAMRTSFEYRDTRGAHTASPDESQVEDSRGIPFVDGVPWIVEGYDVDDVSRKLEQCATVSSSWAEHNAVRFETSKMEAILFSRRRKHRRCQRGIRVGPQTVHFAPEATKWLGIWLHSALTLRENRRRRIGRARQAEVRIRRIVDQYGPPPGSARALSISLIQGTMLYAAELTWSGQRGVEGEYQRAINRMAKSTLGAFRSTPTGILAGESGHTPARPLLDYRKARFAQRLLARPQGGGGPEGILERDEGAVVRGLRWASGVRLGEAVEPQVWSRGREFPGKYNILPDAVDFEQTKSERAQRTIWTDGSRLEDSRVGAACSWQTASG